VSNAIRMIERLVGEHVQIDFHPQSSIPAIYADGTMLDQIAMNLAANARDAMPGGGRILISTELKSIDRLEIPIDVEQRDGDYVCLTFADTGIGMDRHVLDQIFDPFFTTKPVGKGTGLGLSTVFGIVRAHQGWLEVESQPNQGTTFRIYFPASQQAAEEPELVMETQLRSGRETVLVAEDEDALRELVVTVLRIQGYKVFEAASGCHALEVWEGVDR
jgi:signal transduction histidine kinase